MSISESTLKMALMRTAHLMLPTWEIYRIENRHGAGIPDIIATANKKTSWWEAKYADPELDSHGLQDLNINRLAVQGYGFYIVYARFKGKVDETRIVHPREIDRWQTSGLVAKGHDHKFVVNFMKRVHA